jgi:hypothetical protein
MTSISVSPDTVARQLADAHTRVPALEAVEAAADENDAAMMVAAAGALSDLMVLDAAELPHAMFQRVGFLRARLLAKTPPDQHPPVLREIYGDGRLLAVGKASALNNVVGVALSSGKLDRVAALSYAALVACNPSRDARGEGPVCAAAGFGSEIEFFRVDCGGNNPDPILGTWVKKRCACPPRPACMHGPPAKACMAQGWPR